jgi:hypothetical protein
MFNAIILAALAALSAGESLPANAEWNVRDFGAAADASADATPAFAAALAAAEAAGGGTVLAPTGRYRFDGSLTIPKQVTLRGTYAYAPAHAGIRDRSDELPTTGTIFEVHGGAGDTAAAPFISLQTNSTLQGVTIYYPDQKPEAPEPVVYPYTVAMRGNNPALIDVQLLNPYDGIDASHNQRALIRNVHGQPLHLGLYVDEIYDIGRIENVHWNPWWTINTPLYEWQFKNGTGFYFAKTDWHYVLNTFCFGYNIGYHFARGKSGGTNGNFLGIGADDCHTAMQVDESAPMGILVTNGEFVAFHGPDPAQIRVGKEHTGTVRFVNCAFWGPGRRIAVVDGKGTVGFSDCTFVQWGPNKGENPPEGGYPALDILGGSILVRGCDFQDKRPQITLGPEVSRAIISENLLSGRERIRNHSKGNVLIRDNVGDAHKRE